MTKQMKPGTLWLRIALCLLLLCSIGTWFIYVPVPELTKPRGKYTVGTRIFRWVDLNRDELITKGSGDVRNVIVQAWYPTEPNADGSHSAYLDGLDYLQKKIEKVPDFIFEHYKEIDTYGILNAPVSRVEKQWPVIIFLTGYGATRAVYTSLSAGLASYGYVVLALDHPYEAAITTLANGEIITNVEVFEKDDPDRFKFMKSRLGTRVEDVKFVINQLAKQTVSPDSFFSLLDQSRIGIAGHSLGGASAAVAMMYDERIKAAVNIDGTLYGELPKPNGTHHFLLLESNKSDTSSIIRYEKGNQLLFKQFGGGHRYEITEADHYSFTDVPYFLAPPARWLVGKVLKIGQIPESTHTITVEILNAFFKHSLNNESSDIDSVARRYKGILRKEVTDN